jgi:hypothetical protein
VNFHPIRCAALTALALAIAPAWAAGSARPSQAQRDYQQERARCLRGESQQPRATCLKEASAAYAEARRGRLDRAPAADLERNATRRCDAQPPADREDCVQRILGAGNAEGSVGGGGILRRSESRSN